MGIEALIRKNNKRFPTGNKFAMTRMCSWLCMENIHALEILTPYQVQYVLEVSTALFPGEETKLLLRVNSFAQLDTISHDWGPMLTPRIYTASQTFSLIQNARLREISQTGRGGRGALPGTISPEQLVTLSLMAACINRQELGYYDPRELGKNIKAVRDDLIKTLTVETNVASATPDLFDTGATVTATRKFFQLPDPIGNPPSAIQAAVTRILNRTARRQEPIQPHSENFYWGIDRAAKAAWFIPLFHKAALVGDHGIFAHPAIGAMARIAKRHTDNLRDLAAVTTNLLRDIPANYSPSINNGTSRTRTDPVTHPNYAAYAITTTRNNLKSERHKKKIVRESRNARRIADYMHKLVEAGDEPQAIQEVLDNLKSLAPEKNLLSKFRPDASHVAHHLKTNAGKIKTTLPLMEHRDERVEFLTALCLEGNMLPDAIREAGGLLQGEGLIVSLDAPVRDDDDAAPSLYNSFGGRIDDVYFSEGVETEPTDANRQEAIEYHDYLDSGKYGDPKKIPAEPAAAVFALAHELGRVLGKTPEKDFAVRALATIAADCDDPKTQVGLDQLITKYMGRLTEPAKNLLLLAANGPRINLRRNPTLEHVVETIALRATGFDVEQLDRIKKDAPQFSLGL
jgi:hypothetical protein